MEKKKIIGLIITIIILILASIMLIASIFAFSFHNGFCEYGSAEKAMEKCAYCDKAREYIAESIKEISIPAKIPDDIAEGFIKDAISDEMIGSPVRNMYFAEEFRIDKASVRDILYADIMKYAEKVKSESGSEIGEDEWKEIEESLDELAGLYADQMINSLGVDRICSLIKAFIVRFCRYYPYIMAFFALFFIASAILIIKINKGNLIFPAYAFFTANGGIISIASFILLKLARRKINSFAIDPEYFRLYIGEEIYSVLSLCAVCGIIILILGIAMGVGMLVKYNKNKRNLEAQKNDNQTI